MRVRKSWRMAALRGLAGLAIGAVVGTYLVFTAHPLEWWHAADPVLAAARIFGGAAFTGIIGALIGLGIGSLR